MGEVRLPLRLMVGPLAVGAGSFAFLLPFPQFLGSPSLPFCCSLPLANHPCFLERCCCSNSDTSRPETTWNWRTKGGWILKDRLTWPTARIQRCSQLAEGACRASFLSAVPPPRSGRRCGEETSRTVLQDETRDPWPNTNHTSDSTAYIFEELVLSGHPFRANVKAVCSKPDPARPSASGGTYPPGQPTNRT